MAKVFIDAEVCTGKKDCFRVCKVKVFGWEKARGVTFLTKVKLMIESKGFQAVVKMNLPVLHAWIESRLAQKER